MSDYLGIFDYCDAIFFEHLQIFHVPKICATEVKDYINQELEEGGVLIGILTKCFTQ